MSVPQRVTSFIDGVFVAPSGGHVLPVVNPATETVISDLHEADAEQVGAAVTVARRAFIDGPWPRLDVEARQAVFARVCEITAAHLDELAVLETAATGQPIRYTRDTQLPRVIRNFRFAAEMIGQSVERSAVEGTGAALRYVLREPIGPVALISPSNAPTALASTKIAHALAWGNTCVVKTSEQTPLALARFVELLTEAGLPDGTVNLVNGRGEITGDALVTHPDIAAVSFTGGTATARHIAAAAGSRLKRLDLELGGKSANIVLPSADLDLALDAALQGIYLNNGQQCFAGSRIVLHRAIAEEFIERFVERARRIRVGDPLDPATENGPVSSAAAYERLLRYVRFAAEDGARLLTGGRRAPGFERGHYLEPTAVLAPHTGVRVCQEEIFGPFATFLVVDSLDEAIKIANASTYGLVSYVWTSDLDEAMRASRQIQAGMCLVNTPMLSLDARLPFGGYKDSGVGREGALESRSFYTEEKTVVIALRPPAVRRLGTSDG